jgi:HAD superfamily hydrolase (TIGR01484 family)
MRTIYLFDVDGTLTPPLLEIDEEFASIFLKWVLTYKKEVYLVTGSDIKKTRGQLFSEFRHSCAGIFCCSGNELWHKNKLVYRHKFKATVRLIEDLELYLENSDYNVKTGNHIEQRPGMLNFTTIGRNANLLQREAYTKWDKITKQREDIVKYITQNHPDLDAAIGGTISVDIYPKGQDKSQVVDYLCDSYMNPLDEDISFVFVGDKNMPGGNDYPLAMKLEEREESSWFQVWSPVETRALIEHSALFIGEGGI